MKKNKNVSKNRAKNKFVLNLYVAGLSGHSQRAIRNIKELCDQHLPGCKLIIQDIYKNPIMAKNGQIIAAPTLVRTFPEPIRKFIGDMSNKETLLVGLDLKSK